MDDGRPVKGRGLSLCINSYTLAEVQFLAQILTDKYNLITSVQSAGVPNQYLIYIHNYISYFLNICNVMN